MIYLAAKSGVILEKMSVQMFYGRRTIVIHL